FNNPEILFPFLDTFNDAENHIRNKLGLPRIGEGWISETIAFYTLKNALPNELIIQHAKPTWLGRQHLDIFLPKRGIAIEFQGEQHFRPVEFFGGLATFEANLERDKRKRELCKANNCRLIEIEKGYDFESLLSKIINYFN
ncbi:MAG: hypothetical protein AABZ60_08035, partial [Planctomycetota bacterium]